MVRRLLWGFCLLLPAWVSATPSLDVVVDRTEVAAGYPIRLRIQAVDAPVPLHTLDLKPLAGDFIIHKVTDSGTLVLQQGREVEADEMLVTLYPRHSGRLTIPALALGTLRSPALGLTVGQAIPGQGSIGLRAGLSEPRPWTRQEIFVYVDVYDDGRVIDVDAGPLRSAGFFVRPLKPTRRRERVGGRSLQVRRLGWGVMALYPGARSLRLPMIKVNVGKNLLFPLPPLRINARSLPSYVPTDLPVGRLAIGSEALPGELGEGRPYTWRLHIRGRGFSRQGIQRLMEGQLKAAGLRLYPPAYAMAPGRGGDPLEQVLAVTIPFVAQQAGPLRLPALHIPYLDPRTGLLDGAVLPGPHLRVFNPSMALAQRVVGAVAVLLVLGWGLHRLRRRLGRYRLRRRCLRAVRAAETPGQLREALRDWLRAAGGGEPATLQRWGTGRGSGEAAARLQRACYGPGGAGESLAPLREAVARAVRKGGRYPV